jgi:hypothetical protein
MRKYELDGVIETLKTKPCEITLNEFKKIISLQSKYNGDYNYYLDSFEVLGLSSSYIDIIDHKTLIITIKDFQEDFIFNSNNMIKEIEVDGYTYCAYPGEEFKISAREFASIESKMNSNEYDWVVYAIASIFKRTDLTDIEHKDKSHINHKMKIFGDKVTLDVALPYIMFISKEYMDNVQLLMKIS